MKNKIPHKFNFFFQFKFSNSIKKTIYKGEKMGLGSGHIEAPLKHRLPTNRLRMKTLELDEMA